MKIAMPGTRIKIPVQLIKEEFQSAQLIKKIPDVQYRRKNEPDWEDAPLYVNLHYDDSLRTLVGGQADVRFPTHEIVQISENSFVVLHPEKILQEVKLVKGDIRASRAKVIMQSGTVVKPHGTKSDYQAKIREDDTDVVFVYKGKVDVTAKGKTVTVPEGFGTDVLKSSPPSDPVPLSQFKDFNPAELTSPVVSQNLTESPKGEINIQPPVEPQPEKTNGKSKSIVSNNMLTDYLLELATDEDFKNIVLRQKEHIGIPFDLKKQKIPDGTYYTHVAFIDALGTQGTFSTPSQVEKDSKPPVIKNLVPMEGQEFRGEEAFCDVIGDVEKATLLAINGEVVFISPTGRFNKFITLHVGENIITVLARDSHGNETVINRKVTYAP